jgi:hypothetical protein
MNTVTFGPQGRRQRRKETVRAVNPRAFFDVVRGMHGNGPVATKRHLVRYTKPFRLRAGSACVPGANLPTFRQLFTFAKNYRQAKRRQCFRRLPGGPLAKKGACRPDGTF